MRFETFHLMSTPEMESGPDVYRHTMDQIRFADAAGFETSWFAEHHFSNYGFCPNPPRWYCPTCHSKSYEFVPVSGEGTIYSMVINHYTVDRGWADEVPYTSAIVQLKEGRRVVGHLRNVEPGDAALGQAVPVVVEPRGEDFTFLVVELA